MLGGNSNSKKYTEKDKQFTTADGAVSQTAKKSLFRSRRSKGDEVDEAKVDCRDVDKLDPLKQLPEHERIIIENQIHVKETPVNYISLFRYAGRRDIFIIVLGCLCAIIGGALLPLFTVIFGQLAGTFQDFSVNGADNSEFNEDVNEYTLYFVYLGIGQFITLYLGTICLIYTGENISRNIRQNYLRAILRQNIGFFDNLGAGETTTRITGDTNLIQDGISQKVALTLQSLSTFITAFVIGYVVYWKLTLILTSTVIAISLTFGVGSSFLVKWTKKALDVYANGGTIAEETFSSIRNAVAFGTEDKLSKQYDKYLSQAEKEGKKGRLILGFMIGSLFMFINFNYALAFWMGSRFLVNGEVELSSIITVVFAILFGAFSLGSVGPYVQNFSSAVAAAKKIYAAIDRESPINPHVDAGKTIDQLVGNISFRHIKHIYPSRPEVIVLDDINIDFPAGKTTAIVGASGSGKSSVIGLIERFYDPVSGQVLLDGQNLQDLNVKWLRQQMSLVSQEPVLFAVTIFENIRFGIIGSPLEELPDDNLKELIHEAARKANAHDFIEVLPEGYDTNVGDRGFLLSGGQKQRIAIARAIVSDPRVLLLDEATSALDTKSEGVVQLALDRASEGRTTIVIAHRLSTIKDADNIIVMSEGRVVEEGTHNQLLSKEGPYHQLVHAQEIAEVVGVKTDLSEDISEDSKGQDTVEIATEEHEKNEKIKIGMSSTRVSDMLPIERVMSKPSMTGSKAVEEPEVKYPLWALIKLILGLNRKEWILLASGFILSILAGLILPTQAILFGNVIKALALPPRQFKFLRAEVNYLTRWYLLLGFLALCAYAGQLISFGFCAEKLIHRSRERSFRYILRQDLAYFDLDKNSAGALTSLLSTETQALEGLSGSTLGSFVSLFTTIIAALAVGISFGWKLGLVCAATIPILLACGFFRFWVLQREENRAKSAYASSASYACEATSAIRTVASLTREQDVLKNYQVQLIRQSKRSFRSVRKTSILYAASESLVLFVTALGFWYGGRLIGSGEYDLLTFFIVFAAIIFSAQSAGTALSFAPDISKATQAAAQLKRLFDRVPPIDVWSMKGKTLTRCEGSVELKDVHFRYPTRPEQPVLRGLSITADPGQLVALVGASGCGKSTVISLVERFYDPITGEVRVDGEDITGLNIKNYRQNLALVSQEPTLYQGTIRENILLGTDKLDISDDRILAVCKQANIYDFIMSLPDGFGTICGSKGTLLSGGQKQRVAIARALLRDPKILLLDEATSALDSESEKVVQAALDAAAKGRTTITVAHRLSTIQNADVIYVFDAGRIVESGRHGELLAKKGRYYELVQLQSLKKIE